MSPPASSPAARAPTGPPGMRIPTGSPDARAPTGPPGAGAPRGPLTLGTAGHVDHGKTALVGALTGVDTDRLPEERARRLTIVLGYAPLELPSGRSVSLVDVPGHERFVRTMVAGATGIDGFLMAVAADDGVMPQTIEHATVLAGLGVRDGVVAITKVDLAPPDRAARDVADLLPGCPVVACSARTGEGLDRLRTALEEMLGRVSGSSRACEPCVRLHVDRSFTVSGWGTVVTGTLWSGAIVKGASLELAQARGGRRKVRVRAVQVHDRPVDCAQAGQRVAVNIAGGPARDAGRGDVLVTPGFGMETRTLDCALQLQSAKHGERVQVHHGTRHVAGRLCLLEEGIWQLRLERPLLALDGDRLVVRRLAPPDTLGGGLVLDAAARRHGARPEIVARLRDLRAGREPRPLARRPRPAAAREPAAGVGSARGAAVHPGRLGERAAISGNQAVSGEQLAALERRLLEAGAAMLSEAQLEGQRAALRALRDAGRALRVSGRLYAHADVVAQVSADIVALLEARGTITLAGVRDALGLSRKSSQAFLEHLDAARVTRRLQDDSRVLDRRAGRAASGAPATAMSASRPVAAVASAERQR